MKIGRQRAIHFASLNANLGEGPVWDSERSCLWCVDISASRIHQIAIDGSVIHSWIAPAKVGWVLPDRSGKLVVGLAHGLYGFDPVSGRFELVCQVEPDRPSNRINDGTMGPDGAIWFGTMDDGEAAPSGQFYRYDGKLSNCEIPPAVITNGPAVSPDGRILYAVDTLARRISACPIRSDGSVGAPRIFASLKAFEGYPDGVSCDAEGGVWLAIWGGAKARRYDSVGCITDEVEFPVSNVTKVAIGGVDRLTAFVTTARRGLGPGDIASQPLAGDVFTFRLAIPGLEMLRG